MTEPFAVYPSVCTASGAFVCKTNVGQHVSTWLNAGVLAAEVAVRAGHSVEMLTKVYAKCVYGQRDVINTRIESVS